MGQSGASPQPVEPCRDLPTMLCSALKGLPVLPVTKAALPCAWRPLRWCPGGFWVTQWKANVENVDTKKHKTGGGRLVSVDRKSVV